MSDEEKVKKKYEVEEQKTNISYKDFKEKLIGQTFEVKSDIENAIDNFIKELQEDELKSILNENKTVIFDFFVATNTENLRILKQTIYDFRRFLELISSDIRKHKNFNKFVQNLLSYFVITYCEYKSGNNNISYFQSFAYGNKEKEINRDFEAKYNALFEKYSTIHSTYLFPIDNIIKFIEIGHLEKEDLIDIIKQNSLFRQETQQPWEELWYWHVLEDSDFDRLVNLVWTQFKNKEIKETTVVLHISGILISLIENKIDIKNSFEEIIEIAKKNIDKIFGSKNVPQSCLYLGISWGKQYCSNTTKTFNEIFDYARLKVENKLIGDSDNYLKDFFENLDETKLSRIYEILNAPKPDRSVSYEMSPIFEGIDGTKLAQRVLTLNNNSKNDFFSFLNHRYFPEKRYSNGTLYEYHKKDIACLKKLKEEVEKNFNKQERITRFILQSLIDGLTVIISKIESIQ